MTKITITKNIRSKELLYLDLDKALERIKIGKSKDKVLAIRNEVDKEKRSLLKQDLPCVMFSGEFTERNDKGLKLHSGFVILDFDHVNIDSTLAEVCANNFVYAAWVSPSGDGIKALVKIADSDKHRQHYGSLKEFFPNLDEKNCNESRVCFESFDENIYINTKAKSFTKYLKKEKYELKLKVESHFEIIENLLKWLSNKSDAFADGNRDNFIFKFSGACCRFGVDKEDCVSFACNEFLSSDSSFPYNELIRAIESGYKRNNGKFASCSFEKNVLIDNTTRLEVEIKENIADSDDDGKIIDIIYANDTKDGILNLLENGRVDVKGIESTEIDEIIKLMKGEITLLTGFANAGKSSFMKWYLLIKSILYGEKHAFFSPEDFPAEEFNLHTIEMLLGTNLVPNYNKVTKEKVLEVLNFINNHIYFVYPKETSPTPDYIKSRFLKLIINEKVDSILIDPVNQLTNDYKSTGGRIDQYLEAFLSDFKKFSQQNNVYGIIIAHPTKPEKKAADGNYPCPDSYNVAGGAMWANKMDDIFVYNRPTYFTEPKSTGCDIHSKKVRRQTKAKRGCVQMDYDYKTRRYIINGVDYMQKALDKMGLNFSINKSNIGTQPLIPRDNSILNSIQSSFDVSQPVPSPNEVLDIPF